MCGSISVICFIFFLSALCIVSIQTRCKVVINVINLFDPKKPETREFIELKSTCDENLPLRGYKLIGFTCENQMGKVELVVNLWNERMKNRYFVIGGSDVLSANIKIPSDNIKIQKWITAKK